MALGREINARRPELVGCWLVETELRRACLRSTGVTQEIVTGLLDRMNLTEVPWSVFQQAGQLPGRDLRSLDALHLAAALQLDVDRLITYDTRMATAARAVGLHVQAPS